MNATEAAAYRWLLASEGYTPETLTFQRRASPDFLGDDGRGWEVKLVRSRHVTFWRPQVTSLKTHGRCLVVLWSSGSAPELVVPFSSLTIPGVHQKYRLALANSDALTLRTTDAQYQVIRAAAGSRGQSLQVWISRAIDAAALHQANAGDAPTRAILDQLAGVAGKTEARKKKRATTVR